MHVHSHLSLVLACASFRNINCLLHVCIYVCMCVHINTCTHIQTYTNIACMYLCLYVCTHKYMHRHTDTHKHAQMFTHVYIRLTLSMHSAPVIPCAPKLCHTEAPCHFSSLIYTVTAFQHLLAPFCLFASYLCMYVCMYVCMCAFQHSVAQKHIYGQVHPPRPSVTTPQMAQGTTSYLTQKQEHNRHTGTQAHRHTGTHITHTNTSVHPPRPSVITPQSSEYFLWSTLGCAATCTCM